ncbi:hypothetical protein PM082_023859 [Marasmius tenuissimus]|nr:hypothetical protein PM082_023859 [Marasmius tenuissimus]
MEVTFDNRSNVLSAKLHTTLDDAVIYTLETTYGFRGRRITILKDSNPAFTGSSSGSSTVGAINWREKTIEVNGMRKKVGDLKKRKGRGGIFRNARYWQWGAERKEYEVKFKEEQWKATIVEPGEDKKKDKEKDKDKEKEKENTSTRSQHESVPESTNDGSTTLDNERTSDGHSQQLEDGVVGRFQVPFRPHLFTKSKPPKLKLTRAALAQDEVFLVLVFIYSEAKRQDQTNSSVTSEG